MTITVTAAMETPIAPPRPGDPPTIPGPTPPALPPPQPEPDPTPRPDPLPGPLPERTPHPGGEPDTPEVEPPGPATVPLPLPVYEIKGGSCVSIPAPTQPPSPGGVSSRMRGRSARGLMTTGAPESQRVARVAYRTRAAA